VDNVPLQHDDYAPEAKDQRRMTEQAIDTQQKEWFALGLKIRTAKVQTPPRKQAEQFASEVRDMENTRANVAAMIRELNEILRGLPAVEKPEDAKSELVTD
jgi:hypothetical protein